MYSFGSNIFAWNPLICHSLPPFKGDFLTSVDITNVYLHVPSLPAHQRYLCFAVGALHYHFVALPFWSVLHTLIVYQGVDTHDSRLSQGTGHSYHGLSRLLPIKRTAAIMIDNVIQTVHTLKRFKWILKPAQYLEYLSLILYRA